jgi:hypothetical protein
MTSRLLAALGSAAVAVSLAFAAPASAAPAWQTKVTLSGAQAQLCRAPAANETWQVRVRVDATGAGRTTYGRLQVQRPGGGLGPLWSSGAVNPGTVSGTGAVQVPRERPAYRLAVRLENASTGRGALVAINAISAC